MKILNISSNFQNLKKYLGKKRNQQNNGKQNTKKMKTVRLGGGDGTTKHEASSKMDLENGRTYSSRRLKAFPMVSSRTGTQEIVDGNFVVEVYKRMVSSRDLSLDSSQI
ncbi:hypothetical protein L1887_15688 [Cichorium endivia]|nr:hypothetical protein L1887_15688 [Cichorium endivia]